MRVALLLAVLLLPGAALAQPRPMPPTAAQKPHAHTNFGVTREDPYFWLRERDDPAVIAHLSAENAYTAAMTAHTKALEDQIYNEIVGRIKQDDATVPVLDNGFFYYTRYEEGREYPIYARKRGSLDAPEEVMLDVNALAEGHAYYNVGGLTVSEDGNLLAFAADTVSRRIYTVYFKDLRTGRLLPDVLPNTTGNVVWANDNRTVFYGGKNLETLRNDRVFRHALGATGADAELYFEADEEFNTALSKSKSRRYIFLNASQTLSSEVRYLDANAPSGDFQTFLPREPEHEYDVDHAGGAFYIHTNDGGAANFKLMRAAERATSKARWEEVIPHRADVLLEGFELFKDHLVLQERERGLTQIRVRPWADAASEHAVDFGEPTYTAALSANPEYETDRVRFVYTSLTTPNSTFEYAMPTRTKTLLKRDPVVGTFDPGDYVTERLNATAPDGTPVPISLVYRKGTPLDGTSPLLLYGYGSYGASMNAGFSLSRLSLLDRGFVYAIAHIRGGQEMGRAWYDDGKLMKKANTFTDFIAAGEHLVATRYADPARLYAMGGSAGGLLMGAVVNLRPDLFTAVVAQVPFVDVVTTMLDASIPLTTFEYDEWGNPNEEAAFRYMLSYSPYDNVEPKAYPAMLVTTGLHDSQVQYWEPAKWVARLRERKVDANPLLLKTNMEAGHGGASGRFQRFREVAFEYAFLLDRAGR